MSTLDAGTEALVALSAALAVGSRTVVDEALRAAARVADPVAVEETLLQSHLFLGYPAALNGLARWREISGRAAPSAADDRDRWAERGEEVCRVVYGGQYAGLRANVRRLHPDVERWMVEDGYGRVLGRPGLDLPVRELCISAILTVQDAPRQLYSHLRGALNAGAGQAQVSRALELAAMVSTPVARERAAETWTEVRRRAAGDD